MRFRVGLA